LLFGQILRPQIGAQPRFLNELIGPCGTDAVDITEGVRDFLLRGNFYAEETRHGVGGVVLKGKKETVATIRRKLE
jgi:hypothetical protein